MRGAGGIAGGFIQVNQVHLRLIPEGAEGEATDASESIDGDACGHKQ